MSISICTLHPAFSNITAASAQEGITQQYRKALEMNPEDMDTHYLLGVALLREKSFNEALTHLLKVYPTRSNEADMNYNIGLACAGAGELQKAFQYYKKVDELNSVEARDKYHLDIAFYNLGLSYQREGKPDDALAAYQEAIEINPDQSNALCQKGEVLYLKKDNENALKTLMSCRERLPERKGVVFYISSIYQIRGMEYLNRKNYIEARVELNRAIEIDPANEVANYYMGYLEYLEGDYKKALLFMDRIKGTEREDMKKAVASMLHNIGGAMQKDENWEGAISAFSQAVSINSQDPELRFFLGYSYMKAKAYDSAMSAFEETLKLDPNHQRAAVNMAIVSEIALKSHLESGEGFIKSSSFNEALKEFNLALKIDPKNEKGLEGKGAAEKGIEKLNNEAIEKREREVAAKLLEGSRLTDGGKYLEGRKLFESALVLEPGNQKALEGIKRSSEHLKEAKQRHSEAGDKAYADGKYYTASVEYKSVLDLDPEDGAASNRLKESLKKLSEQISPLLSEARKYEDSRLFREAISYYDKVLDIDPSHKEALERKVRASQGLEKAFDEFLASGREYIRAGELMKAAENLKAALDLKPDNEIALDEFKAVAGKLKKVIDVRLSDAALALKAGRYAEAVANYKAVLMIERDSKEAASGLQNATRLRDEIIEKKMAAGIKAYKEGNYSQAISAFGEVLQVEGTNSEALRLQKDARSRIDELINPLLKAGADAQKKGDTETAILSFKKVLNIDPGNREAREHLSKMDTQKTKVSVDKEIEKYYLKGIELYTDGKYREAIESWKKVLELDPKHEKAVLNIEKAKRKMEGVMDTK